MLYYKAVGIFCVKGSRAMVKERCPWCPYETDDEAAACNHLVFFHEDKWDKLAGEYKRGTALEVMRRLNQPRDKRGRLPRLKAR